MINYAQHKQAEQTLRLAKNDLISDASELAYQCRLASTRLHRDRVRQRELDTPSSLARKRIKRCKQARLAKKQSEVND